MKLLPAFFDSGAAAKMRRLRLSAARSEHFARPQPVRDEPVGLSERRFRRARHSEAELAETLCVMGAGVYLLDSLSRGALRAVKVHVAPDDSAPAVADERPEQRFGLRFPSELCERQTLPIAVVSFLAFTSAALR